MKPRKPANKDRQRELFRAELVQIIDHGHSLVKLANVVAGWVENPYWQHFSGMKWFEHKTPIHPSSISRWRKRIGDAGAEQLLKQTIEAGLKLKAVKAYQLKRVNVDTTVVVSGYDRDNDIE